MILQSNMLNNLDIINSNAPLAISVNLGMMLDSLASYLPPFLMMLIISIIRNPTHLLQSKYVDYLIDAAISQIVLNTDKYNKSQLLYSY